MQKYWLELINQRLLLRRRHSSVYKWIYFLPSINAGSRAIYQSFIKFMNWILFQTLSLILFYKFYNFIFSWNIKCSWRNSFPHTVIARYQIVRFTYHWWNALWVIEMLFLAFSINRRWPSYLPFRDRCLFIILFYTVRFNYRIQILLVFLVLNRRRSYYGSLNSGAFLILNIFILFFLIFLIR